MRAPVSVAVVIGLLAVAPHATAQTADKSMTVFVTAAEVTDVVKLDKATEKQLRADIDAARKARKELEKQLKAKHGNKRENWPPEAEEQYFDAEEAEALANADWEYRRVRQAGLADSADDLKKSLAGEGMAGAKENVTLVSTREEAQLVVEVDGRRSSNTAGGFRDNNYWVTFKLLPGPKLATDRFKAAPRYRFRKLGYESWRLAIPRDETPFYRFEAYAQMRWGLAANVASAVIEDFIAKNYDVLVRPTTVERR
jgi:hypothetical protein